MLLPHILELSGKSIFDTHQKWWPVGHRASPRHSRKESWVNFLRSRDATCCWNQGTGTWPPRLTMDCRTLWWAQIRPSAASLVGSGVSRMLTTLQETVPSWELGYSSENTDQNSAPRPQSHVPLKACLFIGRACLIFHSRMHMETKRLACAEAGRELSPFSSTLFNFWAVERWREQVADRASPPGPSLVLYCRPKKMGLQTLPGVINLAPWEVPGGPWPLSNIV